MLHGALLIKSTWFILKNEATENIDNATYVFSRLQFHPDVDIWVLSSSNLLCVSLSDSLTFHCCLLPSVLQFYSFTCCVYCCENSHTPRYLLASVLQFVKKKTILTWTITRAGLNEGSVLFICSTLKCMSGALTHATSPFPSTPFAPPTPCSFSILRWRLSEHSQTDRWPLFVSPKDL